MTNIRAKVLAPVFALLSMASHGALAGSWTEEREFAGELDTFLYVPSSEPRIGSGRALMVSLHGCVQRNDTIRESGNWEAVAEEYGMVVAVPQASGEGSFGFLGCWNFHEGPEASRTESDQAYLIAMVEELLGDESLNIDPAQVYLTGLSSGGGIANQLWCMAPEIFAGVGVSAGPTPGSKGDKADLGSPSVSIEQGKQYCLNYAAQSGKEPLAELLNTQLWNSVHGSEDGIVVPAHAERSAGIARTVYADFAEINDCNAQAKPDLENAQISQWCDAKGPRVSSLLVSGMGHAWPAGEGVEGFFVDGKHVNYPAWITEWFFANNRRVQRDTSAQAQ
ncbi:extracellular catalytic domain type 1 short-chain-length polyhydroxyalkanoate depolymerase [Microbulbifer guangxiensis]|uniref:extracellular catalytic domain type 1 short-chain-length polyhydroxyalkanoate depolymerase n=1 Tax=Microbulbifer guangxiensis TaxID=2904249 RepID=UPI001F1DB54A|nr:PHB depolymerase family esterase [Microbulbifer guangxiensis]